MILEVDPRSTTAPYEQLRQQISAMVVAGALPPGTRLPSIRQLANDLGLAGGTVARAYRELEADGVVSTHGRHGTVVHGPPTKPGPPPKVLGAANRFVAEVTKAGATLEDAVDAVRIAFATERTS